VLEDLGRAYNDRNVDDFLACLSEDFMFHFSEHDVQNPDFDFPPWFYKSDEQQVHENMFGDQWDVETISLTLTVASVETIPGGDSGRATGDVVVIRVDADLRILKSGGDYWMATDPQEFRFREVAGSGERDGRILWEMFEWHDLEWDNGARVEDAGWGGIKYCFLESLSETAQRTSPAEVIDQLEAAYVAMDSLSYLDCLSEDFIFFPNEDDVNDPGPGIPSEWYKPDERTIHGNMFDGSGYVESISLILTNTEIVHDTGVDPEDPLDDTYVHTEDVYFLMYLHGGDGFIATEPSEFHLRVDQDEEGPYGETMWEVYEWYDLDDGWRDDASENREHTSWGGIKALFR
jgi:hypothetical protein